MYDLSRIINADGSDVTVKVVDEYKKLLSDGDLYKAATFTTSTGLTAINLEAPSKNLYPFFSPLVNATPRKMKNVGAGVGPQWKQINSLGNGSIANMPLYVPEGQRGVRMSVNATSQSGSYVTIGLEADDTFEATGAAAGFEDLRATTGTRLLQALKMGEEKIVLGGNSSVALGTPTAPTVNVVSTGGSVAAGTYNVAVVALSYEGYQMASVSAAGCYQVITTTGMDNQTIVINGGSSNKSTTTSTGAISGNANIIQASTPVVVGAMAYAWYVGVPGSEIIQAITTINSVAIKTLVTGTQNLSAITADCSTNSTKAYNGYLYSSFASGAAYYYAMPTGTLGTGTGLTAGGNMNSVEIDTMFQQMWTQSKISPKTLWVSASGQKQINACVLANGGIPSYRIDLSVNGMNGREVLAGASVSTYLNPYSANGNQEVAVKIHPFLPSGTILATVDDLPIQFQNSNTPNVAEIECRADYYEMDWALNTRAYQKGVYVEEVLKVYFPAGFGIITNIAN